MVIVIAGLKLTFGLDGGEDIGLYDESDYLYSGVTFLTAGPPQPSWAPLYAIWYFILSFFEPNRTQLYYLNYKLMVILLPVFTYVFLRVKNLSITLSLAIAAWVLLLPINAKSIQKVSHFSILIIFINFIVLNFVKDRVWFLTINALFALLVAFVRPEYFLAFVLFSVVLFAVAIAQWKAQGEFPLKPLLTYALPSIFLLAWFGLPISGDRSLMAFGQHFSIHWVMWNNSDFNPWTNWEWILSQNFGNVHSVGEVIISNSSLFFKHILANLGDLRLAPGFLKPRIIDSSLLSEAAFLFSIFIACLIPLGNLKKNILLHKKLLLASAIFLLTSLVSIFLIYPREHYILGFFVPFLALIAICFGSPSAEQSPKIRARNILFLCSLLLILTPLPYFKKSNPSLQNLNVIAFLQSINLQESVRLLEAEGGYNIYLGSNFKRIPEYSKQVDFDRFLQMEKINGIILSEALKRDRRFKTDREWLDFLNNYQTAGFVKMDIPNTEKQLLLKADLLN
ncbi:hypothetical protein [Oscillatoria sp. FACHB-1406]|uniref:hypothetical protein n=1 Tax=Oscillatoria sp. FACHB-1406 TaxID=2692846 RepID=UPI001686569C|nr:hypothetical protein [Oscillatoria sp. FACHB-1406]